MGGNLSGIEITIFTERNGDIAKIEGLNFPVDIYEFPETGGREVRNPST